MERQWVKSSAGITASMMFLYLAQWGAQYIGYNYLPIYIDSLPFSTNSTTGLAIAVGAATTSVAQPVWGRLADRARTKNQILVIALLLEALAGLLFFRPLPQLWILLVCIVAFYIPFLAPQTLIDTVVVENMHRVKVRFGMLRCFSSGGAALMAFLFGLIGHMTHQKAFTLFSVFAALTILPALLLPKTSGHAGETGRKISYRKLLSNRRFVLFLCYGLALFFCGSMINSFFPIYISTEKGLNAGVEWYGIFMGVTILLEATLMFCGSRLFARLNPYVVFMCPLLAGVFRMLVVVLAQQPSDLYIYPIFHALWFAPLWAKVAPFIQSVVPDEMRATGQSLWTISTCGIAPVLGSLLAGILADAFGMRQLYLFIGVTLVLLSLLFLLLFWRQSREDRRTGWHMTA